MRVQEAIRQASRMGAFFVLAAVLAFMGCGGGSASAPSTPAPTLSSIAVSPGTYTITTGQDLQFTAKGSYSDGTSKEITQSAAWSSSDATKATVNGSGMASGVANGTVTITAALSGASGTAKLIVAGLSSLSVGPLNPTINAGETQQFFATANYTNHSSADVTDSSAWASSEPGKATVQSQGDAHPGLASSTAPGSVVISASFGGITGSSTLTLTDVSGNATRIPLMNMTPLDNYLSFAGGLYENSSDLVPADHDLAGVAASAQIRPLDADGNPSPTGKVVFLSVGRSITEDEFAAFISQAQSNAGVNHTTLVILNGAGSALSPCIWMAPVGPPACDPGAGNQYDRVRDEVLAPLGLSEKQIQAIWIENYDGDPAADGFQTLCNPSTEGCSNDVSHTEALRYVQQTGAVLRAAKARWPNLRQAFQASRIYGGYADTEHSAEPYAYEYGFAVKWLIQAQIVQARSGTVDPLSGDLNYANGTAPWTAWGPYLWANGDTPRSDGLVWCNGQTDQPCNGEVDFWSDGTHPAPQGVQKVANLLMNFFLGSPYTPWFRP